MMSRSGRCGLRLAMRTTSGTLHSFRYTHHSGDLMVMAMGDLPQRPPVDPYNTYKCLLEFCPVLCFCPVRLHIDRSGSVVHRPAALQSRTSSSYSSLQDIPSSSSSKSPDNYDVQRFEPEANLPNDQAAFPASFAAPAAAFPAPMTTCHQPNPATVIV